MKKILILAVMAVAFGVSPAFAEEGADRARKGGHHKGKMFEKADTDGDGAVRNEEFSAFHGKVFDKMDMDGDGQITPEEQQKRRAEWKEKMKERREARQDGRQDSGRDFNRDGGLKGGHSEHRDSFAPE